MLQEFRRIPAETLSVAAIKAIKHPSGGGESPAVSLVAKGYLTADPSSENFMLTEKAKAFLALDPKPEFDETPAAVPASASEAE